MLPYSNKNKLKHHIKVTLTPNLAAVMRGPAL